MQPSERDPFAPDSPVSSNPPPAPEVVPPPLPVFEAASAPVPFHRPLPTPPPLPPVVPVLAPMSEIVRRVPRWRWFMSLLLIGFYPALISLLGELLSRHAKGGAALPSSSRGLVVYVGLDMAIFGVFWLLGWAFSRANKDELLLRWRGGWKPILSGFGWALGIRLAIMMVMMFVFILVAMAFVAAGHDPKELAHLVEKNQPKTDALFPKGALSNPLYLFLTVSLLSFVAAGLREELWRTACLAALRHLLPGEWSDRARWIGAIILSSVIFGLGHVYQGGLGVVITGVIGAGLGVLTWRNRSIWPSVWAHGFFDATSFLLAAAVAGKKIPLPAWF